MAKKLASKYSILGTHTKSSFNHIQGTPPFSALVADLAFQQLTESRKGKDVIWDPYCGNGVILRTISVLHRRQIAGVIASDIREEAVAQTSENLQICSTIEATRDDALRQLLEENGCEEEIIVKAFSHNVLEPTIDVDDETVGVLLTDPPYEEMEEQFEVGAVESVPDYLPKLLQVVRPKLKDNGVVGLILGGAEDFSEVLGDIDGYEFHQKKQVKRSYKNRVLYHLTVSS